MMKRLYVTPVSVMLVLAVFAAATFLVPASADAKWKSDWEDYPGEDSPPWGTIIAIGVAGGLLIALITHSSKKEEPEKTGSPSQTKEADQIDEAAKEEPESSADDDSDQSSGELTRPLLDREADPRLGLYFDVDQTDKGSGIKEMPTDLSEMTVKMGVSFSF